MTQAVTRLACIVLAAGSSKRFGGDKRLAQLADGNTLLGTTLANIPRGFAQYILALRPGDDTLASLYAGQWQAIFAPDAAHGMGHSLAAALAACNGCDGALVVLADMPAVQPATCSALAAALQRNRIVLPFYKGRRGNPVGIGTDFFAELSVPAGDLGARQLLQRHPDAIIRVDCEDAGVVKDIDRQEDLNG